MTQVAFVSSDNELNAWRACQVNEVVIGDIFYMVADGKQGSVCRATGKPYSVEVDGELVWRIESIPYE